MTSKECLKRIDERNYLTQRERKEFLKVVRQDLSRLKKLEKTIELLKARVKMLETYHEPKSRYYYLYIGGRIVLLSREEYELLKEVLEEWTLKNLKNI